MRMSDIIEAIEKFERPDQVALVRTLIDRYGMTAEECSVIPVPLPGLLYSQDGPEEPYRFKVIIEEPGSDWKQVAIALRQHIQIAPNACKSLLRSGPIELLEVFSKEVAEQVKADLEAAGATVITEGVR